MIGLKIFLGFGQEWLGIPKLTSKEIIGRKNDHPKIELHLPEESFKRAEQNGVKTIYNLTDLQNLPHRWGGTTGYITPDSIKQVIPDYQKRLYYLSGPQLMVQNFEKTLKAAGVQNSKIKTDFFPGYSEK